MSVAGMVSTVDHLATGVGVDLLRRGGSAADAAVGANAVLAVTSPHMCGPGGDVWARVDDGGSGPPRPDSPGRGPIPNGCGRRAATRCRCMEMWPR